VKSGAKKPTNRPNTNTQMIIFFICRGSIVEWPWRLWNHGFLRK
jgi:hypothetical protein